MYVLRPPGPTLHFDLSNNFVCYRIIAQRDFAAKLQSFPFVGSNLMVFRLLMFCCLGIEARLPLEKQYEKQPNVDVPGGVPVIKDHFAVA